MVTGSLCVIIYKLEGDWIVTGYAYAFNISLFSNISYYFPTFYILQQENISYHYNKVYV